MNRIYVDHAATTPLEPAVLDAMLPFLKESFGNPSSSHWLGEQAADAVEHARERPRLDRDGDRVVLHAVEDAGDAAPAAESLRRLLPRALAAFQLKRDDFHDDLPPFPFRT